MSGSIIVDVAIGLILVYLSFSLLCSAVNEWIARLLALRATGLRRGLDELFDDAKESGFANLFHAHPLIDTLKPVHAPLLRRLTGGGERAAYPSYISPQTFALTVLDMTAKITSPGSPGVAVRALLKAPSPGVPDPVPPVIRKLLASVDGDAAAMQLRLETWFNDSMSRVSGWYKRRAHVILLVLGLIVAFGFNVDTFAVVGELATEPGAREALVKQADNIVQQAEAAGADTMQRRRVGALIEDLQRSGVSVGWDEVCSPVVRAFSSQTPVAGITPCRPLAASILGILITAIGLSFGAPFWFDALNKLVNLRQAGQSPNEQKK
jgi:hypothetical protein